jgi:hypothetical protein
MAAGQFLAHLGRDEWPACEDGPQHRWGLARERRYHALRGSGSGLDLLEAP